MTLAKNCLQANLNFYRYNVNTYLFTFSVEIFQDSIKLMSLNLIKNNPLFWFMVLIQTTNTTCGVFFIKLMIIKLKQNFRKKSENKRKIYYIRATSYNLKTRFRYDNIISNMTHPPFTSMASSAQCTVNIFGSKRGHLRK